MSIYQKLANIQCALLKKDIPKSGYNKHKGFKYHELEDLIPPIFEECMKEELTLVFTFVENAAILKIRDWNGKDEISVRVTMPELVIPDKNPNNQLIQAVGANVTYMKRYLLVNTFLIIEKEVIDASNTSNTHDVTESEKQPKKEAEPVRELNFQELLDKAFDKLKKRSLSDSEINAFAVKKCIEKMVKPKLNRYEKKAMYVFVNDYFKNKGAQ